MDALIRTLCDLMVAALQGKVYDKPIAPIDGLFQKARENGLSGIAYSALPVDSLSEAERRKFKGDWLRYQARDVAQRAAVEELDLACEEAGLDHLYLKGVVVKDCYPEPYMRSMGDIDVLFKVDDMTKVHEMFETKSGYRHHADSEAHDVFMKDRDLIVEAHRSIDVESDEPRWKLFGDPWKYAFQLKGHLYAFEPEYFLLHLLRHLAKHLLSSGIGLRSVLDIGLFIARNKERLDVDTLKMMLQATSFELFFSNILVLNQVLFNLDPMTEARRKGNHDSEFIDELVEYISASGIHGTAQGFNQQAVGMTKNTMEQGTARKGRIAYLFKVAFPARKTLWETYPYLKKHGWLLPVAWIERWWKKLFRESKRTMRQIHNLGIKNDLIATQASLFSKLGL